MKNLRASLEAGEILCGPGVFSGYTGLVELIGYHEFDFVFLDTEQSPPSPSGVELERLIQAAEAGRRSEPVTGEQGAESRRAGDLDPARGVDGRSREARPVRPLCARG